MNSQTKVLELGDARITVRELTVADVRQWLADAEKAEADGVDVVGSLLLDDISLADLTQMTDASVSDLDALPLSALHKVVDAAKSLNPDFFALRGKIIKAARQLGEVVV